MTDPETIKTVKSQPDYEEFLPLARRLLPALLTLLALWLAWQGQALFSAAGPDGLTGALLRAALLRFGLAALCLVAARQALRPPPLPSEPPATLPTARTLYAFSHWRWAATGVGLLVLSVVLAALWRVNPFHPPASFAPLVAGWIAAIALVAGAWLPPLPSWGEARARLVAGLRAGREELLALAAITLFAGGLRLANLGSAPFTISGDEGSIGLEVLRILRGELRDPFGLMWGPLPSLSGFWLAPALWLFGPSPFALRLTGALVGTLAIPALYALGRVAVGRREALAASLLLATLPMHLHYSRVSVGVIWDSFFFSAALAALLWGLQRPAGSRLPFVLAGLLGGIGQYGYSGSRLLPILVVCFLIFLVLFSPAPLRARGAGLAVMIVVFLVVASPILLYAFHYSDEFNARVNQMGVLQSGWLEREMVVRGQGALPILWDQFRRALFGFAFFPDGADAWGPGTPLAPPLFSLGLFLGLVVSLRHWRTPAIALLQGWWWATILVAGTLTLNPPSSNRLVGVTPVLCLFAALGWAALARALAPLAAPDSQRRGARGLLAGFVALTALTGLRAHQQYLAHNNFGGDNARLATHIGYDLAAYPTDTTLVMLGAPRLYSDTSPLLFLTPEHPRLEIGEPLSAPPTHLPPTGDLFFAVVPERASELPLIQQRFPDSMSRPVYDPITGELLYHQLLIDQ